MAFGVCKRIIGGAAVAVVRYPDGVELEIEARRYRLNGYAPPLEELPECAPDRGSLNECEGHRPTR